MTVSTALVPRKRRNTELVLVLMALGIGVAAYTIVGLATGDQVPADLLSYSAGLVAPGIVAHAVVRFRAAYADPVLLPMGLLLNGLGLAMIHRIDLAEIEAEGAGADTFAGQQQVWMTIGIALFVVVLLALRDHRRLQGFTYTAGAAGLILLMLPLIPGLGIDINGARIWVRVAGLSFQPGEVAKLALAVFFAGYLVVKRDVLALAGRRVIGIDLPRGRDLGPILLAWLASLAILVFQRDLGSSLLFFGLFVVLLYVATERPGWIVVGAALFGAGSYVGYLAFGHVRDRVEGWLHPFSNVDQYYQLVQGMYGMAWGGVLGRGLGQGRPNMTPFSYSDFIAASMGEELGLAGLMAILVIYGLMVERGLRIALICRDTFGKLLAVGLAVAFALQVFIVIGGVTRLIPLTGLTTPFLSYGGSSLVANWVMVALLLRISDQARRPTPEIRFQVTEDDATQVVMRR